MDEKILELKTLIEGVIKKFEESQEARVNAEKDLEKKINCA